MSEYMNILTGEIVKRDNKTAAILYFQSDARKNGYCFDCKAVKRIVKKTGCFYGEKTV